MDEFPDYVVEAYNNHMQSLKDAIPWWTPLLEFLDIIAWPMVVIIAALFTREMIYYALDPRRIKQQKK